MDFTVGKEKRKLWYRLNEEIGTKNEKHKIWPF